MATPTPPPITATAAMARENKRTILYEGDEADVIVQKLALLHVGVPAGTWPAEVRITIELLYT